MREDAEDITLPSSTVRFNRDLDEQILRQEPPDELTRAAPWYQRRFPAVATAITTAIKAILST